MTDDNKPETRAQSIRVNFVFPNDLQSHFVSNAIVQHQPEYFTLSFFEAWPPPILAPTEEEQRAAFKALASVEALCVARFVITPSKMREIVAVLKDNLEKYDQLIEALKSKEGQE